MIIISLKAVVLAVLLLMVGVAAVMAFLQHKDFEKRQRDLVRASDIQKVFDLAPFGVLVIRDGSGHLQYANDCACQLLTLAQPSGVLPDLPWRACLLADLSATQFQEGPRYRTVSLSERKSIGWWIHRLPTGYWVLLTDLNRQHQIENATQSFVDSLSHELRTPLTAILAHIEVLRRPDIPELAQTASLDVIHRETLRLSRLVHELLVLNRLEIMTEMPVQPLNVVLLAEDCISEVFPLAEARKISILLDADSPIHPIPGNQDYLKQVFLNLLDNAIKYCRAGDEINVEMRNSSQGVSCQIMDSGPGIPREHLPYVTQKFYRANDNTDGSGLGLALVSEILRRHNSRLELRSLTEGERTGTTARFILPAKD